MSLYLTVSLSLKTIFCIISIINTFLYFLLNIREESAVSSFALCPSKNSIIRKVYTVIMPEGITFLWLRRISLKHWARFSLEQGCLIWASGPEGLHLHYVPAKTL